MSDTQAYLDPTVLSGDSPSGGAFDVQPPMAAPGQQSPNVPAADMSSPAAPDVNGTPAGVAPTTPIGNGQTAGPAAPAHNPPVWQTILQGALWGMANSGGATHFGGGLAAGAAGVMKEKQQQVENAQRAQQLQFESVRAADSHIQALDEHKRADQLSAEDKLDYKMKSAQYQNFLQDNFGIEPNLSFNDSNTQANAGLQTLSQSNNGQIPSVSTVQHPEPTGTHGKIAVYSPTQQQLQQNSTGFRKLIDTQRAIQGLPPVDDRSFNSLGFKGQRDAANAAIEFLKPTVAYNLDKSKPDYLPNILAQKQQQLDQYQAHKDANGNTDANPAVVGQLKSQIDFLNKAWSSSNKMENDAAVSQINATAPAKASAAAQETKAKAAAELQTPQGRAAYAKTQQETINAKYKNAEDHQKALFNEGVDPITGERLNLANAPDEALIDSNTGKPIPTKMLSTLKPTQQESNRADFAKSALHSLDIIDQLKAGGKLPNGPITGWTTKALEAAGLNGKDAADAIGLIALTQSAATGAHVGGRFSAQIMDKMNGLLTLNSNDQQFEGQELALRQVMQPYAQQGGRQTVAQYKQETIGTVQTLKSGQKVKVTGLDKNGNFIGQPVK